MRLDEVTIGEFKNLRDFHVNFDESSPYTVLVGENGSGKSNLIEALSLIFRNLDLDLEAPFSYNLKYRCREYDVGVRAAAHHYPQFSAKLHSEADYRELARKRFMRKTKMAVLCIALRSYSDTIPDRAIDWRRFCFLERSV